MKAYAADGHLRALCANQEFLPNEIRKRLHRLHNAYRTHRSAMLTESSARSLSEKTMELLEDIRAVLAKAEARREAA